MFGECPTKFCSIFVLFNIKNTVLRIQKKLDGFIDDFLLENSSEEYEGNGDWIDLGGVE
tara:strand:+ start:7244 stop:7420 length:177 start_codon:yes stop_codon:yes gene_type:complete